MDPDEFMREESEEVPRTRMFAPSSSPPAGKRSKDRQELDKEHKTVLIEAFIDFCYWQTLAPIALSGTTPPTNVAVRYVRSTVGEDLFIAQLRDRNGDQIVWNPVGETRRHVFHGDVNAADHPVSNVRFDVGGGARISAQRAWLRGIRSIWIRQHQNKDHEYSEYVPNRSLRVFEAASLNRIALQNFRSVADAILRRDADTDLTRFLFPDMFRLAIQKHEKEDPCDPDDMPLHVPTTTQVDGGEPGEDYITQSPYRNGTVELRVWVNQTQETEPLEPPREEDVLKFYSVYLNLMCARFVTHVLKVDEEDENGSISL